MSGKLTFAVVCSSNMNRSMEAHSILSKKGFTVFSFGTGDKVRIPGPTIDQPNVYDFSTTYNEIYQDLQKKDETFYRHHGLLSMIDRNRRIKEKPQRFQETDMHFDVIITCEERIYDDVTEHLSTCGTKTIDPVHIINVDIEDNQEEATIGAFAICELATLLSSSDDLVHDISRLISEYEKKYKKPLYHCVLYY